MKTTFRVSPNYPKVLRNRKRRIERRLTPRRWKNQPRPMMRASNIHYELSGKIGATSYGGIGAMHTMAQSLGLVQEIDQHLELLKIHLPYHESDHVLNVAYNILSGGQRLEDIELRRQDEKLPQWPGRPAHSRSDHGGDFTRRFDVNDITTLQERINRTGQRVWRQQPEGFLAAPSNRCGRHDCPNLW